MLDGGTRAQPELDFIKTIKFIQFTAHTACSLSPFSVHLCLYYYLSLLSLCIVALGCSEMGGMGYSLDRSPVHHRADVENELHMD